MKRALGSFLLWTFTITGLCWGGLAILGHWGVLTLAHPAGVVLHLLPAPERREIRSGAGRLGT